MTMPVLSVSLAAIVSLVIAIMVFAMRMMMTHSNDLLRMMTMTMFETLGARGLSFVIVDISTEHHPRL